MPLQVGGGRAHPVMRAISQAARAHSQAQQAKKGLKNALTALVAQHLAEQVQPQLGQMTDPAQAAISSAGQQMMRPPLQLPAAYAAQARPGAHWGGQRFGSADQLWGYEQQHGQQQSRDQFFQQHPALEAIFGIQRPTPKRRIRAQLRP